MAPIIRETAEVPPKLQAVLDKLEDVTHTGGQQYKARCPAHDDGHASLSVSWGDKGKVILNCHANCTYNDITKALGLGKRDLEQPKKIVATYDYEDEDGELVYQAVRFEPKGFSQRQPDGKGGWIWGTKGLDAIPFHLPALADAVANGAEDDTLWIVEGEKDVLAIEQAWGQEGNYATCNHGGVGMGWSDDHSGWVEGWPGNIVIVADNDDSPKKPGQRHALSVYESVLRVTGIEAEIVYAPIGKDAADAVGAYDPDDFIAITPEELREEIATAAAENPDAAAERAAKVEELFEYYTAQREARALVAAEHWEAPPAQGSWAEQQTVEDEPINWLIPHLAFEGANVVVNAQAKSGKTTLILNVAHSLLSGEPLFGHFDVAALPADRSVAWWNAELDERQAKGWLRDFDMPRPEAFFPLHLRGYAMPFEVQKIEDWAVAWLSEHRVSVWLIDPLSALYAGDENSNTEMGAWLSAIDRIKRRAGVESAFLVHHVAESSAEEGDDPNSGRLLKGRGASRLTGWADVLWSYSGRFDEPRYLAALGRDVDMPQFGGLFSANGSRLLRWNGKRSTPTADRRHALALAAYDKAAAHPSEKPLNAGQLQDLLPGRKPDAKRRAIAYAVEQGWVAQSDGPRNSTLYSLGAVDPRHFKMSVATAPGAETGSDFESEEKSSDE